LKREEERLGILECPKKNQYFRLNFFGKIEAYQVDLATSI